MDHKTLRLSASLSDLPDEIFEPAQKPYEKEPEDHVFKPYPEADNPSQIFEHENIPDHVLPAESPSLESMPLYVHVLTLFLPWPSCL